MCDENCINIIGPYVRKLREEKGWSLERLADEFAREGIPVSPKTLEEIELRREIATELEIFAFARIFQTNVAAFFPEDLTKPEVWDEIQAVQRNDPFSPKDGGGGFVYKAILSEP